MNEKMMRTGIIVILLLTVLSIIPLRSLKFEFSIEKLFPVGDPELEIFQKFREQFHAEIDDEFIFIGLKNRTGIFQKDFLAKTDSLTRYISGFPHIQKVYSLTSSNILYFDKEEINARPLIRFNQPEMFPADSVYVFQSKEYRDLLISKDGKSISIAAFNQQHLTDDQKDSLLYGIQQKINQLGFDESHLTAKIRVERVYVQEIEKNLRRYLLLSLLLISLSLFILFRSFKAIIFPLLVVVISVMWTLSLVALTGNSLDIISSLIPPIMAVICMSDVIHISTHYIEQLRSGLSKIEALNKAFKEVGLATFYTCCTVATGFFTLGITNIIPIRNFGFFTGIGLLLSFGITMISLYVYYFYSPIPAVAYEKPAEERWNRVLAFLFSNLLKNRIAIFLTSAIVIVVSVFYLTKVEINSSLLQEIPRNSPILDDYKFMETDFSGTRPFELALTARDSNMNFFDVGIMKKVESVEQYLRDSCGIGYIISPLSLFKGANKAFNGGDNGKFKLPGSPQEVARYYEGIMQTGFADEMNRYMSSTGNQLRISGRLPNLAVKEFKIIQEKMDRFLSSKNFTEAFSYNITGSAVLLDKITFSLTKNLFSGIYIDIIIISLIAFLLLRKWQIILIALIPNAIPLVIMAGIMGAMGINLKADTSVIFAISFGIAVDDTIHFLSRLRLELSKGTSLPYAVKRTYLSTGKAIIITTIVLLSGFLTLLSSSFGGTFYIGLLISVCLFFAALLDLTLTPLLILLFFKRDKISKTTPEIPGL